MSESKSLLSSHSLIRNCIIKLGFHYNLSRVFIHLNATEIDGMCKELGFVPLSLGSRHKQQVDKCSVKSVSSSLKSTYPRNFPYLTRNDFIR